MTVRSDGPRRLFPRFIIPQKGIQERFTRLDFKTVRAKEFLEVNLREGVVFSADFDLFET